MICNIFKSTKDMVVKFSPEDDMTEIVYLEYQFSGYKDQVLKKNRF